MSDNKIVKIVFDVATLRSLTAGISWGAKKTVKENFTAEPSSNAKNYVKFTVVLVVAIALKQYLEKKNSPRKRLGLYIAWQVLLSWLVGCP